MNCQAPVPGDGVPLQVSNPQSNALRRLQAEVDRIHASLSDCGIRTETDHGATASILTLEERVGELIDEVGEAHRLLTERGVAALQGDSELLSLSERIDLAVCVHRFPPVVDALAPFADDDPMLPVAGDASPRAGSSVITAAPLGTFVGAFYGFCFLAIVWLAGWGLASAIRFFLRCLA